MQFTKEQEKAIYLKGNNILVAAGAGSGKTSVLVERIINKIVNDKVDIDRLLVVTFTNAAASEMKERILDRLYSEAKTNPNLEAQISKLFKANISTIDSFCMQVVKDNFFCIDLDPNFRIGEKAELELLKEEVLEELFEEKFEEDDENFTSLFNIYSSNRGDENLSNLILRIYNFMGSLVDGETFLNANLEKYKIKDLDNDIQIKYILDYSNKQINEATMLLQNLYDEISGNNLAGKYIDVILDDLNSLKFLSSKASTWDELYKAINNLEFSSARGASGVPEDLKAKINEVRSSVKDIIVKNLKEKYFIFSKEDILEDYDTIYSSLSIICDLVKEFAKRYMDKKLSKNILDFSDVEHFAYKILNENEEVNKRYKEQFEEILIDEYQDSNLIQESILNSFSKENVFMVGDVKQSIYKFRKARPELFLEKYNKYINADDNTIKENSKILLFKNFRSNQNIIDEVNYIFANIMNKEVGDIEYNEEEYLKFGADCYVEEGSMAELCLIETSPSEEDLIDDDIYFDSNANLEGIYIANKIKSIVGIVDVYDKKEKIFRKAKYKDIVILLRSSVNRAEPILEELNNMGIPAFTEKSGDYFENTEVQTILSYLRIIDNPYQDIPLVSIMRSQIGGFTIDELSKIRLIDRKVSYYQALLKYLSVEDELSAKVDKFVKQLLYFREKSKHVSIWELLWNIYTQTGYYYFVSLFPDGYKRQLNLKLLIERAEKFEKMSIKGIFNFLNFIDNIRYSSSDYGESKPISEDENVVRIMSVHKSKGLEFPIVILSAVDKRFNVSEFSENIILDQDFGFGFDIIDYDMKIKYESISKRATTLKLKKDLKSEEMRILYVALTRAREKLIVTGLVKDISKFKSKHANSLSEYKISSSNTFLDWIAYAVLNNKCNWKVNEISYSDIIDIKNKYEEEFSNNKDIIKESKVSNEQYNLIDSQMNWHYKYEDATMLPNKISISEIKRRFLAQNEEESELSNIYSQNSIIPSPKFLEENYNFGANYGTMVHEIMQKIDFTNYDEESAKSIIANVVEEYALQKSILKQVKDFTNSKLYLKLKNAKSIYKEKAFNLELKASEIYDTKSDEKIMVQGIIDLYFFDEQNNLILVDYKTDNLKTDEEFINRYKIQLNLYKQALEEILNAKVSKTIIYSFRLQKEIELE